MKPPDGGSPRGDGVLVVMLDDEEQPQVSPSPSRSPSSKVAAPKTLFKSLVTKLSDEHDQVTAMLDKEIHHRVQLEALVASLRSELEKRGIAKANSGLLSDQLDVEPDAAAKTSQPSHLNGNFEERKATQEMISPQSKESEDNSFAPKGSKECLVKSKKQEHVEELELIKGWAVDQSENLASTPSLVDQVGLVRARTRIIVESQAFDAVSAFAIIYNAALLGAASDYSARNNTDPSSPPTFYQVSDRICTGWFLIELCLRLGSAGLRDWLFGPLWAWNVFDFIVVASDVLMTIIDAIMTEAQVDLSFLRMLRVLRVTRAIRVVRLVRFFKELRMMVFSVLRSGTSLLWSLILFGLITYIFGIFLMQQVTDHLWDQYEGDYSRITDPEKVLQVDHFKEYWGSLTKSMYTMYACMSSGIGWSDIANELHEISWINSAMIGFFIFFCTVVVMNIITGIFVDTAIQSAQSDRDEIIQEQIHSQESELAKLKQAFLEADNDGSMTITLVEFQDHLKDQHVRAHLASIGLEIHEAMGLFKLLDIDGSGAVGIEEFVIGCMRLKGSAKSIDLATLMYENKRMLEQASHFHQYCEAQFDAILQAQELMRVEFNQPLFKKESERAYLV